MRASRKATTSLSSQLAIPGLGPVSWIMERSPGARSGSVANGLVRVPPMPSGEGLPAQRGVRVHHLEVEERTVIGERRRNVAEQFEGDGTVQLGVGDHARSEGAVGKAAAPVVLVAPRGELPACRKV